MASLRDQYIDILARNGIKDKVKDVDMFESGAKGDGLVSITKRVKVTFEDSGKPPLNLFIKMHTENPAQEQFVTEIKAFVKEARFFMDYLPDARQFCENKGLPDLMNFYPKCYFGDEQLIVLEDLMKERGFEMTPHGIKHDFNKATISLTTLAKHHAISFAMISESGGGDKFFKKYADLDYDSFGAMLPTMDNFDNPLGTSVSILEANNVDGATEALAHLRPFTEMKYSEIIKDAWAFADPKETSLVLLNHGDYKNNNMLFRTDEETGTVHHIAIDLQVTRYDSPVWDVAFYLFTSVDHTVRQTQTKKLFSIYLETLKKVSISLGHPIDLTYEDLWSQYRKRFEIGFWAALVMVGPGMEIMKTLDIEEHDFSKMGDFWKNALNKWFEKNPDKVESMADEIVSLVREHKFLKG